MSEVDVALAERIAAPAVGERLEVESVATQVTLFEDRAEVVRRARAALPEGMSWVLVSGMSAAIDDASLLVQAVGEGARVLAARVVRRVSEQPAGDAAELGASEEDWRAARVARQLAECALSRAEAAEAQVVALSERWFEGLARVPRGGEAGTAAWRQAFTSIDHALSQALDEVSASRAACGRARREEERAELRYRQARLVSPRYHTAVEVQVNVMAAGEHELRLTYRTPCALWRPEHVARLGEQPGGKGHTMELVTLATVWQATGEAWRSVVCRFSTARPAEHAAPPPLADDVLELRRKGEAEQKEVQVEARDQEVQVAGLGRGVRSVEEMPGVEDGGEPQWFEAERPLSIPSDGQPVRVEIGRRTLECAVERVALPERSQAAYLRATATLTGKQPLLAGPVRVGRRGELVGRGRIGFVPPGEPFELSFGVDDGVRVRRQVTTERETAVLTGTQRLVRKVRLYLSNLGGTARDLVVTERTPVSEIRDVTVTVLDGGGATLDERDGFARFTVTLAPGSTAELGLVYRIEAAARVRLPF